MLTIPYTDHTKRCDLLPAPAPVEPLVIDVYRLSKAKDDTYGWRHPIDHYTISQANKPDDCLELQLADLGRDLPTAVPVLVPVSELLRIVLDAAKNLARHDEATKAALRMVRGSTSVKVRNREVSEADEVDLDDDE
jgi:hypothetical protein